jgi:hypothetical protein
MKYFQLSISFLILCFYSRTIWSDIVLLKSGKTIEGKFIETNSNYTIIDNFDRKIKISNIEIDSIEVGYSGIPVCYKIKDEAENCKSKLHLLSQSKVVLVSGKGFLDAKVYNSNDLLSIKGSINSKEDSLTKYIRIGIGLEIVDSNSKSFKGKLISISDDGVLTLESPSDKVYNIPSKSIKTFSYYSPSWFKLSKIHPLVQIVPGLPQINKGEFWKGSALMGFGAVTFFGAAFEYNNARNAAKPEVSYLPLGTQLVATSAFSNNKSFEMHKQNFQILTAGFILIYAYHFYDIYSDQNISENSSQSFPNNQNLYSYQSSYPEKQGPYSIWNFGNSQYFEYSLQF